MLSRPLSIFASLLVVLTANVAFASDYTNLNDAADDFDDYIEETYDAFDFSLTPILTFEKQTAQVTREAACVPNSAILTTPATKLAKTVGLTIVDPKRCPNNPQTFNYEQLDYLARSSKLDIDLRIGLYKDLEFRMNVPYVFSSSTAVKKADTDYPNSLYPSDAAIADAAAYSFVPPQTATTDPERVTQFKQLNNFFGNRLLRSPKDFEPIKRSGFKDPTFGIHWGIYNDHRDNTKATLNIGFDYTAPLAKIKNTDNSAVGEGVHVLDLSLQSSKRFQWLEPYVGLDLIGRIASADSPISKLDYPKNQGVVEKYPPQSVKFTLGTEFVPYEDIAKGQRYALDLRLQIQYNSLGRDYSPLYDQFVGSQAACKGVTAKEVLPQFDSSGKLTNPSKVACAWLIQQPSNSSNPKGAFNSDELLQAIKNNDKFSYNAITKISDYSTITGRAALHLQPSKYVAIKLFASFSFATDHLISGAGAGKGSDGKEDVSLDGPEARKERNPSSNAALDDYGRRLGIIHSTTVSGGGAVSVMF